MPALERVGVGTEGDGSWGSLPVFDTHLGLQGLWAEAGTGHAEEALSQQGFNPSSLLLSCFFLLLHLCKRN